MKLKLSEFSRVTLVCGLLSLPLAACGAETEDNVLLDDNGVIADKQSGAQTTYIYAATAEYRGRDTQGRDTWRGVGAQDATTVAGAFDRAVEVFNILESEGQLGATSCTQSFSVGCYTPAVVVVQNGATQLFPFPANANRAQVIRNIRSSTGLSE